MHRLLRSQIAQWNIFLKYVLIPLFISYFSDEMSLLARKLLLTAQFYCVVLVQVLFFTGRNITMSINKLALIRYKTIDDCLRSRYRKWCLDDLIEKVADVLYQLEGASQPA